MTVFVNVGPTIGGKIPTPSGSALDHIDGCFSSCSSFDPPDADEVLKIIDQLKPSAAGHDDIRAKLVKDVKFSNH